MNRFATTFFILLFTLAAASTAFATTYYSKFGTGFVYDLSHWTTLPNGTGSNPSDFTSGDTFVIQSGHLYQTSGNNWTVSGAGAKLIIDPTGILSLSLPSTVTVPECFVANTGQLFIQSTGVLTIGNGNAGGYDLVVEGSLENQGVLNYNAGGTGIISSGGQYHHEIDGGTIPVFTWAPYSKANIDGIVNATIMSGLNQSFWELIWGSSSQQSVFQCNSQLSNVHILTVVTTGTGSLVLFNTSSNLDLSGFVQWAGTVNFATTPAVNPTITFKGDSVFRQIGAGSLLCTGAGSTGTLRFDSGMTGVEIYGTIGAGVKYQLLSGAWVEMQNNIPVPTEFRIDANATLDPSVNQFMLSGAGDFILNSGGTLRVSHINGITTSPTLSGGIQVTGSRIYNSGANYVYLNAASVTGNGLPATVGKFGAVGCFLSLSNSLTVTDSFTVISATVDIGSDSLTLLGGVSSDLSGKITSAGNGTVSYLKTSGGQNILTNLSQYGNLTFNNYSKSLPSGTLFISNVFSPGSANPVVHASNIININGTGTQPIPGFRYAGLNISKSAGTAVFPNVSTDTVHISGAFTAGFSPTYDLTGSTVEFNSSTVSQYTGHLDYHNLVLRNTYQKVAIGAFITVNGLLDIGGQGLSLGATNNDNASEVIVRAGAVVDFFHPSAILTVTDGNGSGYDLIVDGTIDNSGTLQYGGGATGLMNGTYMDNHDGGTIPEFTWGNGSTAVILGIQTATTLSGLNQSFYHLTYNSSGQSSALNFNSQLTNVAGTFDIQNTGTGSIVLFDTDSKLTVGKFNLFSGTVNLSVSESAQDTIEITGSNSPNEFANPFGSLTITGGSGAHGVLHFIGAVQTAYISGAISSDIEILVSKKLSFPSITNFDGPFIVESGGILNKSTLIGSGSFELKAGGTIVIADAAGITESGATGDIRMSGSRTFSPGGRYIYENTILQNTGDGLPSVVSVLSVKNSVGVTLNRSVAVADTLFFDDQTGLLYVNTDTLSIGGTTAGYVENLNAGNGTVIYSSTADGQGVIPTTYFNLLFSDHSKNLNAGTYTVENLFDPGTVIDHAIASGSTFDFFGTTSLSVPPLRYGNLTISGNRSTNVVTFSNTDSTYISGALTLNAAFPGGGGYQTAGSKLVFNGTGAQTLPDLDFGTLVVSKPTGTLSASANISVKDNLALLYGTLDDNGFIVTVNGNIEGSFGQHITGSEG
ncbi:MAG: beta strand repeat-containing protein, partial [Bacteroidota bacterium]